MQKKTALLFSVFASLLLVFAAAGTASALYLEVDMPDTAYAGNTVTGTVWIKDASGGDNNLSSYQVHLSAAAALGLNIPASDYLDMGGVITHNTVLIGTGYSGSGFYSIDSNEKVCNFTITIPSDALPGQTYSVNITREEPRTYLITNITYYCDGSDTPVSFIPSPGMLSGTVLTTVNDTITVAASTPYNISYIQPSAGGTISGPASKNSGSTVTVTAAPSSGYQFDKLIVTRNGTGASVTSSGNTFTMPAFDVNVTAQFKLNPTPVPTQSPTRPSGGGDSQENSASTWLTGKMYSVSFIMNGHGTQVMNQSLSYGSVVAEPYPAPTADGYTFNGWYSDKYLTSKYIFSTPVTYDINLYAGWTQTYIPAIPIKTPVPQASTPAPLLGILAGLSAAAVFFGLRRT